MNELRFSSILLICTIVYRHSVGGLRMILILAATRKYTEVSLVWQCLSVNTCLNVCTLKI